MATKTKSKASAQAAPTGPVTETEILLGMRSTIPLTTEGRLQSIEAMGERINEYILFMCKAGSLGGTSNEARDKAVAAFYDRMVVLERQLSRIQEDLRLG